MSTPIGFSKSINPSVLSGLLPGLLLTLGLAGGALLLAELAFVRERLHVGPLLLVILLGMAVTSIRRPGPRFQPGIRLAQRPILRWGVAGLGLKLSLPELLHYGAPVLLVVLLSTAAAFIFGVWIARRLGLDERFGLLLSTGGAICGASAIVAADSVVQAPKSYAAYSLGIITLLGTIGIIIYPPLGRLLGQSEFFFGVWNGATLHEMAQVVAAGDGYSEESKVVATAVKLARICLLAPLVFMLGLYVRRRFGQAGTAQVALLPWFLVIFVILAGLNSLNWISPAFKQPLLALDLWLLCVGMAGVGLHAGWGELRAAGLRPLMAGALQWLVLALVAYALMWLVEPPRAEAGAPDQTALSIQTPLPVQAASPDHATVRLSPAGVIDDVSGTAAGTASGRN